MTMLQDTSHSTPSNANNSLFPDSIDSFLFNTVNSATHKLSLKSNNHFFSSGGTGSAASIMRSIGEHETVTGGENVMEETSTQLLLR